MIEKQSLTGIEKEVQIRHVMENHFNWLHNTILRFKQTALNYATENVTASVGLVQKLSQA